MGGYPSSTHRGWLVPSGDPVRVRSGAAIRTYWRATGCAAHRCRRQTSYWDKISSSGHHAISRSTRWQFPTFWHHACFLKTKEVEIFRIEKLDHSVPQSLDDSS